MDVPSPQSTVAVITQGPVVYKYASVVHPPKAESHGLMVSEAGLAAVAAEAGLAADMNPETGIVNISATIGAHLRQDN